MDLSPSGSSGDSHGTVMTQGDVDLLQVMVEGSPDGLCLVGPDRTIRLANRAALALLGLLPEDGGGRGTAGAGAHVDFDWPVIDEASRGGMTAHRVEILRDGRRLVATACPVASPGSPARFIVLVLRELEVLQAWLPAPPAATGVAWPAAGPPPIELIARSQAMAAARDKAVQYAAVDAPVLLLGEAGTGKAVLARMIHETSARREGPFLEVRCGGLPEAFLEAELFGQTGLGGPGAGAPARVGLIDLAHRGTLLLREVEDLPPALQVKLLRFIDDGEVWPIGAVEPRRPDVRILASSSRDLGRLAADGGFRADLYYRLNGLTLGLPPLRERRADIGPLIEMMLAHLARTGGRARMMAPAALEAIARCPFPDNARELWGLVEQLVLTTGSEVINVQDLPAAIASLAPEGPRDGTRVSMRKALRELEAQMVRDALVRYGTQTEAARHLGVTQSTVARKAKQYGLGRRPAG